MSYYDAMQVCLNGHQITDSYHSFAEGRKKYCHLCGVQTIFECPNCRAEIRGTYHEDGVIGVHRTETPMNCHECGAAYPWKRKVELRKLRADIAANLKRIAKWSASNGVKIIIPVCITLLGAWALYLWGPHK